jgi:hypothetical protein
MFSSDDRDGTEKVSPSFPPFLCVAFSGRVIRERDVFSSDDRDGFERSLLPSLPFSASAEKEESPTLLPGFLV